MVVLMFRRRVEKLIDNVLNELARMSHLEREFLSVKADGLRDLAIQLIAFTTLKLRETEDYETMGLLNDLESVARELLENTLGNTYIKSANELLAQLNTLLYLLAKLEG